MDPLQGLADCGTSPVLLRLCVAPLQWMLSVSSVRKLLFRLPPTLSFAWRTAMNPQSALSKRCWGGGFWLGVGLVRVDTNEFCGLRVYAVTLALLSQCESKLVRDPRHRFIWISAQFPSRQYLTSSDFCLELPWCRYRRRLIPLKSHALPTELRENEFCPTR